MGVDAANLTRKTTYRLAGFFVSLGILLFVPAWSFDYWQAWVFWIVFLVSTLTLTVYFLKRDPELIASRLRAGPTAEKERNQKVIQGVAGIFSILLIAVPGLDYRFQWSQVPPVVVVAGDVLVLAGFLIVFLVFRENRFASATIEVSRDQKIISTGPYRLIRHPMYSGALLMFLSAPLALGSYWALLFVAPIVGVILWRLFEEERFLTKNLAGYAEYCRRTRCRLAPWIW